MRNFFAVIPAAFCALLGFLFLASLLLGAAWLGQSPSEEELYSNTGRYLDEFKNLWAPGGINWWSANFLGGQSSAAYFIFSVPSILGLLVTSLVGDAAGLKVASLLALALQACGVYLLGARLTGDRWVGALSGALSYSSAQILLRVSDFEHFNSVVCLAFAPFVLWAFLKVAEEGSHRASFLLAVTWSGMALSYAKLTLMFLPLALFFFVWILWDRPDRRVALVRGTLVSFGLVLLMAGALLLPLQREYQWMAIFSFDNLLGWQQSFSLKNIISVLDRGNGLLADLPPMFTADRGQFYIGLIVAGTIGLVFWQARKSPAWLSSRQGVLFRLMLALTLLSLWFSHGPYSVFTGLQEFLKSSSLAPDWIVAMAWFVSAVPPLLIYGILPANSQRGFLATLLILVYLFVPGFLLLEQFPFFSDIRAPWGFWEVGFFTIPVAGAMAIRRLLSQPPAGRKPLIFGGVLALVFLLDASAYYQNFFAPGLPAKTFTDFNAATNYLQDSSIEGRVAPLSGRYFYLRVPMQSGRGLNTEAARPHFQMRGLQALVNGGHSSRTAYQAYLRVAGVSHLLLDKRDPFTPPDVQAALSARYPTGFDSEYIRVLENKDSLAPAFIAKNYLAMDPGTALLAPVFLELVGKTQAVPIELGLNNRLFPHLLGTGSNSNGIELISSEFPEDKSAEFRRVPFSQAREDSSSMVFNPSGARAGWLVVTEAWHPDWRAYSDGLELPVYKAFGGLMAIPLGQTEGPIAFIFVPPSWYSLCVYLSGISWVGVLGLLLLMPLPLVPAIWRDWWSGADQVMRPVTPPTDLVSKVVVVIPTYNERESIDQALDLVVGLPREVDVLVVDDGSPDGTAEVVRARSEYGKRIFLLTGHGKAGLGTAYRRGFEWALTKKYDAVVEMDADLSHDPADIPQLLQSLDSGAHLAVGSRYLGGISVLNWPQSRLFISTFGGFYVRTLTALPMSDPTSGFKAIRSEVLQHLDWAQVQAEGYAFQIELHHTAWKQGYRIREVPIIFTERSEGDSKMSMAISFEAAWRVLRLALNS